MTHWVLKVISISLSIEDSNKNESNAQLSDESKDDKSEKSRKPSFDEYSVKNAESSSLAEVEARINIPSSSKVNKPAEENNPKPNVPPIINLAEINTIAEEDSLKTSYRESEDENRSEKEVKESDKDKTEPSIEIKRDTLFSNTNNQKNIFGKGTTTADSIPQK